MADNHVVRQPVAVSGSKTHDEEVTGVLVLADGTVFRGEGFGAEGETIGTLVFDTRVMGFQELLTDPASADHLFLFTFPHVGAAGTNKADMESAALQAAGCIVGEALTTPSNWRSEQSFDAWFRAFGKTGLAGVDTRAVAHHVRDKGSMTAIVAHDAHGSFDIEALRAKAAAWTSEGKAYAAARGGGDGPGEKADPASPHVVVIDYGVTRSFVERLMKAGLRVTVAPATISADDLQRLQGDGLVLSNGPGNPADLVEAARPAIAAWLHGKKPLLAVGLGHLLLATVLGARTTRLPHGHHGANHPARVGAGPTFEIVALNQDYAIAAGTLPESASITRTSLFDGTIQAFELAGQPLFSCQHYPESTFDGGEGLNPLPRFVASLKKGA